MQRNTAQWALNRHWSTLLQRHKARLPHQRVVAPQLDRPAETLELWYRQRPLKAKKIFLSSSRTTLNTLCQMPNKQMASKHVSFQKRVFSELQLTKWEVLKNTVTLTKSEHRGTAQSQGWDEICGQRWHLFLDLAMQNVFKNRASTYKPFKFYPLPATTTLLVLQMVSPYQMHIAALS